MCTYSKIRTVNYMVFFQNAPQHDFDSFELFSSLTKHDWFISKVHFEQNQFSNETLSVTDMGFQTDTSKSLCDWLTITQSTFDWL